MILNKEMFVKLAKELKELKEENEKLNGYICAYEAEVQTLYEMLNDCEVDTETIENVLYNNKNFESPIETLKKENEKLSNCVCEYEMITDKLYDMLQNGGVEFDEIEEGVYEDKEFKFEVRTYEMTQDDTIQTYVNTILKREIEIEEIKKENRHLKKERKDLNDTIDVLQNIVEEYEIDCAKLFDLLQAYTNMSYDDIETLLHAYHVEEVDNIENETDQLINDIEKLFNENEKIEIKCK